MLGKSRALGKWKTAKSWQVACYQSNACSQMGLARREQPGGDKRNSKVPARCRLPCLALLAQHFIQHIG
jgi:hypothetical protein